ncbi:ELM1/GtrOC1 family putative glycosyltransferase [Alkanindiges sp. WGS2144]|uniref:ELM1/GtrOC1 family putative glycosyltransferase n=1 Tax=Alkanindiges sp. WGS2144 TaxID=3366808 RepID=UPI0037512B2E
MPKSKMVVKPTKVIWVISDGIPGHFNQSKGILLALEQLYSLRVEWVDLRLRSGIYRRILSWLLNHSRPALNLLSWFYRGQLPSGKPDMVIGAGGKSAFAVAWIGQFFAAKVIFAGSLRQLRPELFDAVLILEPSTQTPFISLQTSPMPINQPILKQAADAWLAEHNQPEKPLWAMLIGGDGAGAHYQDSDWQNLALHMNTLAEKQNIQWLITSSRRTGNDAEQVLRQHLNNAFVADAVWWSDMPYPVTSAYLGLSEVVFCTIDSMSMMMESISAMRPVVAVKPEYFVPDDNFQQAIDRLKQQQLIASCKVIELSQSSSYIFALKPLESEPSITLAQYLADRLAF